ncbi:MAG: ORF6N domain-containing protein [Bacteroidetes bacterium]|nr:ORF6N domain-containing protein [Bacteroidota bacterium]
MTQKNNIIPDEILLTKIYFIRGQKVMLDRDLAELYQTETKKLKQAVKRNASRFPEDFMFELRSDEYANLRSQIVTSSQNWGGSRYMPMAFTEQGITMLSCVLNSPKAIDVNIRIIRVFTRMREMILTHKDLLLEIEEIRKKMISQDERLPDCAKQTGIDMVLDYLTQFITHNESELERQTIGFKTKKIKQNKP